MLAAEGYENLDLNQSERGATLLEAALSIALLGSLLVFVNAMVAEEMKRQRNASIGRDLRLMTQFAQQYVRNEYDNLRHELATLTKTDAIMEISMQTLADKGYLPLTFLESGEHRNSEGQFYVLLLRGVSRLDVSNPKATLAVAEIDMDNNNQVDTFLNDGESTNDELDIEVLLATVGGSALLPQHGNPAALAANLAVSGFVQTEGLASGPFGSWSLDISPYNSLNSHPEVGSLVSIIALSGFGVLDFKDGEQFPEIANSGYPFDRCPDLVGNMLDICGGSNDIFTDAHFDVVDTDGDGTPDEFGEISGLYSLTMGPPIDGDGDGIADHFPEIAGTLRIACDLSGSDTVSAGTLLMDCSDIKLAGNVAIGGNLTASGNTTFEGNTTAERFFATTIGNQDLTKGIYFGEIIAMNGNREIAKPNCGDVGSSAMILVAPASYASPDGSPIVGLKAVAENIIAENKWVVRLQAALDRDIDNNGEADVVDLQSKNDYAIAFTKCS